MYKSPPIRVTRHNMVFFIIIFNFLNIVNAQNRYTIEEVYLNDSIKYEIKKDFFESLGEYKKGFNRVEMDTNFQKATQQHADFLVRENGGDYHMIDGGAFKSKSKFITHNREYYVNGVFIKDFNHHVKMVSNGKYDAKGECILMDSYEYYPELRKHPELYKPKEYTTKQWAEILLNQWLDSPEHKKILMYYGKGSISFSFQKEKEIDWDGTYYYTYNIYVVYIVCD